jgi:hypothetical protein
MSSAGWPVRTELYGHEAGMQHSGKTSVTFTSATSEAR